jgi:hypothetical protein
MNGDLERLLAAGRDLFDGSGRFCPACDTPAACAAEGSCEELERLAAEYQEHDVDEERRQGGER